MDANMALQAIATVGFPIVVCGFVLWDTTKKIESLTDAVHELSKSIVTCPLKEGGV